MRRSVLTNAVENAEMRIVSTPTALNALMLHIRRWMVSHSSALRRLELNARFLALAIEPRCSQFRVVNDGHHDKLCVTDSRAQELTYNFPIDARALTEAPSGALPIPFLVNTGGLARFVRWLPVG